MTRALTPERRAFLAEVGRRGGHAAARDARAEKAAGMAAAVRFRESRRCREPIVDRSSPVGVRECRALGWQPCIHRPDGAGS